MKYVLTASVLALVLNGMLFATGTPEPAGAGVRTVTIWTGQANDGEKALFDKFNSEHSDLKLSSEVIPYGNYAQKVIASYQTHQLPDVLFMQPRQPAAYGPLGYLKPLNELVDELGGTNTFSEQQLKYNTIEGKIWGIPIYSYPHALFYRRDWFEQRGFKPPKTWNEFEEIAAAFTKGDVVGYVAFLKDPSVGHLLHQWMAAGDAETFGPGQKLIIDNPNTVKTLNFLYGLYKKGYMNKSVTTYTMGDARLLFQNGGAAMVSTSSSFIDSLAGTDMADKVAVTPMPKNGGTGNYFAYRSIGLTSDVKNLNDGMYVLRWMNDIENQRVYFEKGPLGYLPANKKFINSGQYLELPRVKPLRHLIEPALEASLEGWYPGMKYGVNQYVALFDTQNVYQNMLLKMMIEGWSAEQSAKWAQQQMAAIMER